MPELYNAKVIENKALLVPIEIVEKLNLQEGDELQFSINENRIIEVEVIQRVSPILELAGIGTEIYKDFDLQKERESWRRPWDPESEITE
jgi:antitoxin component of MazEF toxin-antitoxin module